MGRLILWIPLICMALAGQDSGNAIPRNDQALANAIAGLGKRKAETGITPKRIARPEGTACSVPLRSMPIDGERQFASRHIEAPKAEPMPLVAVPAPACETASF